MKNMEILSVLTFILFFIQFIITGIIARIIGKKFSKKLRGRQATREEVGKYSYAFIFSVRAIYMLSTIALLAIVLSKLLAGNYISATFSIVYIVINYYVTSFVVDDHRKAFKIQLEGRSWIEDEALELKEPLPEVKLEYDEKVRLFK